MFLGDGFNVGTAADNDSGGNYASWTFRKQPKFFDVVTYTGTGSVQNIAHNLGSTPGCIIVKSTNTSDPWWVYHRGAQGLGGFNAENIFFQLQSTAAYNDNIGWWNNTAPTDTVFTVGTGPTNTSGTTYAAYIFAHDAAGFGLTGTDNVISCGSFTTDGSGNATVNLGYEPQWLLFKDTGGDYNWQILDNMRSFNVSGGSYLYPNLSNAESSPTAGALAPNATGFSALPAQLLGSTTFIYIAIRRGPMKVPTTGTSVFTPAIGTTDYTGPQFDATFPRVDLIWEFFTTGGGVASVDRLRGDTQRLKTNSTAAEVSSEIPLDMMYGAGDGGSVYDRAWMFGRAPSFFDEVCYTGTGSARTVTHNLGAVPELMIVKKRNSTGYWNTYHKDVGNTKYFAINDFWAPNTDSTYWNNTSPTSSVFTVGTADETNGSGSTFVAYLFSTCAGVSKVGSYTGTGTTKQIDCGFTSGARFVLIRRVDAGGDGSSNWYVWDSARGIMSGNDPYLLLNSTAAEVTNTDYVDTYSAGFEISSTAPADINASGGTFIFLAIA
jgi:hypothetical protein